ncbi:MAG: phosphoglycerate kinase [Dehalococcoidia bacterium]|nr:phosphoglycerate kinase [Dehalococcoidia bacterium]
MADNTFGISKQTVHDGDFSQKNVFLRADLNVPLDGKNILDDTRIRESLPTIKFLLNAGASVVLASHLGRPNGEPIDDFSLEPVARHLEKLLSMDVIFSADCIGVETDKLTSTISPGEIVVLENLRFHKGEEKNDLNFANALIKNCDVVVNDAFGVAHRSHASTVGVCTVLPAYAGLLLEKEIRYLQGLVDNPPHPFAAIVGGAKVSSKIATIEQLLPKVDALFLGGGMANTFLKAQGVDVAESLVEDSCLEIAVDILDRAEAQNVSVYLPIDAVIADGLNSGITAQVIPVETDSIVPAGKMILDTGPESIEIYLEELSNAAAIIWNGPLGVFEVDPFGKGSFAIAEALANLDAITIVGGGETAAIIARSGNTEAFTHVSTGGGASLQMLEGEVLPAIAALQDLPA